MRLRFFYFRLPHRHSTPETTHKSDIQQHIDQIVRVEPEHLYTDVEKAFMVLGVAILLLIILTIVLNRDKISKSDLQTKLMPVAVMASIVVGLVSLASFLI